MSTVTSFVAAAKDYAIVVRESAKNDVSKNQHASKLVAIGYLSRFAKKDINEQARKIGGYTDDQWSIAKVPMSQAYRAIAGDYGFGEKLATMWANGDFSISLAKAYAASAGPKKRADKVAQAVKLLLTLTETERDEVNTKVAEALERWETHLETQETKFDLLKQGALKVA